MIKKLKKNKIIYIILQMLKKQKTLFNLLQYTNKTDVLLLEFLWLHKLILGYQLKKKPHIITVYLKSNKWNNSLILNKPKLTSNIYNLKKIQKWSKNSFFVIFTIKKGISTIKQSLIYNIGGFLLYKLY